ncbi:MAG: glycosyltransferase family 4 protein [Cyanobacteriota bacterium]|nr:glycosyltransferase family 4 protein [Cyanobacteriota bacterium]
MGCVTVSSRALLRFVPESLSPQTLGLRWQWRCQKKQHARLTIVSQFFPPDFAATGQFIDDLSRRLVRQGLQILVLTGQPNYAFRDQHAPRISFDGHRCIRRTSVSRWWPSRIRGRVVNSVLFCMRSLLRLMRSARRGDLLLLTSEPAYLPLVGWVVHRLTRAPYVLLLYDLYPDIALSLGVLSPAHPVLRLWRAWQGWALADAREVVVLSPTMAEQLRRSYPDLRTPVQVIPSWADPNRIRPLPRAGNPFVRRHGLDDAFTVLYAGNQGRCHDLDTLLDAARLLRQRSDIRFLIVGGGARHQQVRQRVHEEDLQRVTLLPYQDQADLPAMLAAADLAVVSLLAVAEGQVAPSKLYGHLAAATPVAVICGPDSYLRREVEAAGCGAAFANGDAVCLAAFIERLVADPQLARRMGLASRRHLQRTATPELVVQRYSDLLARHLPRVPVRAVLPEVQVA